MRLNRLAIVLSASLVPAVALAQDVPNDNPPPPAPAQPAPTTNTTVVTPAQPAPAPQQQPVVVVNPQNPAPQTTVVPVNPEGNEVYDDWNAPVFATGALVFGGSYAASAIVAGSSNHPGADRLYVPVVGPWLALNDWGNCPIENPNCDTNTTQKVLLVADGIFQAAGLITMIDGVLEPTHHTAVVRTADKKVHVTPTTNGFAVFGHF